MLTVSNLQSCLLPQFSIESNFHLFKPTFHLKYKTDLSKVKINLFFSSFKTNFVVLVVLCSIWEIVHLIVKEEIIFYHNSILSRLKEERLDVELFYSIWTSPLLFTVKKKELQNSKETLCSRVQLTVPSISNRIWHRVPLVIKKVFVWSV